MTTKTPVAYIKWRDASHSMSEHAIADLGGLAELEEIGFLIKETEDTITLATETQDEALSVRFWLTIPKVNIVEQHRTTIDKAFRLTKPRPRKQKPTEEIKQ